jgi:dolichol kinase
VADVASSLIGMKFGKVKLPYSTKKSWAGLLAFFLAALLVDLAFLPLGPAMLLAFAGAVIESLPIPEADNLTVPFGVGLIASL